MASTYIAFSTIGRTGNEDLFGTGAQVGFAGPNIYGTSPTSVAAAQNNAALAGMNIAQGGWSTFESDAIYNDQRLTLVPTIRVNNAIRVHGVYNIGGYRNNFAQRAGGVGVPPFERYYMFRTSTYVYGTSGIGSWEQVRLTVQLPICILSIGVKDFPFGTGASLANHTASDAWFMIVPWGPFRIFFAQWLARNAVGEGYGTIPDSGVKRDYMGTPMGLGGTYDNANLQFFWLWFYQNQHLTNFYAAGGQDLALHVGGIGFK